MPPISATSVRLGINWNKLTSLCDTKARAVERGRQHWTSAFPRIEEWIASVRLASTAASSEHGLEISFFVDSGDDFYDGNLIVSTTGVVGDFQVHEPIGVTTVMADTAIPAPNTALPSIDTATAAI